MALRVEMTEWYRDWIDALRDRTGRARIQVRIERLIYGNPGKHRRLSGGVSELKIEYGPGYRVYYTERDDGSIVLLAGGDKSTQPQDIGIAVALARHL